MSRARLKVIFAFFQMISFATAQDESFVCWSAKNPEVYQAKEVKSAVRSSATRERAYVAVRAHAEGGACSHEMQLFVSGRTVEFRKVFEAEPAKLDDGNDMRLIGWNREGTKLRAELGRFALGRLVQIFC